MLFNPTRIRAGQLNGRYAGKAFPSVSVSKCGSRHSNNLKAVAEPAVAPVATSAADAPLDYNQLVREGHYEAPLVHEQVRAARLLLL